MEEGIEGHMRTCDPFPRMSSCECDHIVPYIRQSGNSAPEFSVSMLQCTDITNGNVRLNHTRHVLLHCSIVI